MLGLGTIINCVAIITGGVIGLSMGRYLTKRYQESLVAVTGVCVLFIGVAGTLSEMFTVVDGHLKTQGILMMIVCFAIGTTIGELLYIEGLLERFGVWLKLKIGSEKDNGFVTASLTVCIGAMAVIGLIEDGIRGDITTLEAKAFLDMIIIMVMVVSMGKGCVFSFIPVFFFQGSITLLARWVEPLMTTQALSNLSLTGSVMIFCVGLNLLFGKKVAVANTFPALVIAVAWAFF